MQAQHGKIMQTQKIMKIRENQCPDFQAFSPPFSRKIAIASDHAGFHLKEIIKKHLVALGYECEDFGATSEERVDFPDFAAPVAEAILEKKFARGILICGTGIGMCIAANKFPGIRAALCYNIKTAKLSREHNDANILALGGRTLNPESAKKIVSVWLTTEFEGGRYEQRNEMIRGIEGRYTVSGSH